MSHTVVKKCEFTNLIILEETCQQLGIRIERDASVSFYDGRVTQGVAIHIPNWKYPAVLQDGQLLSDTYGGQWGAESELNKLQQAYGVNLVQHHISQQGWQLSYQHVRDDGCIEMTIEH